MRTLTILHTNDIHSHFEQMAGIARTIRENKAGLSDDEVLVVDCGDHLDRAHAVTEGSGGAANVAVMNATGYEAAVLGNNEGLTFTPELLRELYAGARFPILGSNIAETATGTIPSWQTPYLLLDKGPLKVAMIGLTFAYNNFYRLLGWEIADPFESARQLVTRLRPQADLIIALSHLGLSNDERLAVEAPGIDVILGGHTHHLLEEPVRVGGAWLCATGKFGRYIGEVRVDYDLEARRVAAVSGRCIEVESAMEAPDIDRLIDGYKQESAEHLGEMVTVLKEPLPIDWDAESVLGNLIAAGLRKWTDAEVGLVNAGQMLQGLPKGVVTKADLHELCPSPVNPARIRLSGAALHRTLEESLAADFKLRPIRGFGFRGERLGMFCVDGLTVEYAAHAPEGRRIQRIRVNGQPLDPERDYFIGTIDMFTFGVAYSSIREGKEPQYFLPEFLRDVLARELTDEAALTAARTRRWIEL
ncbi:MAG: metallophosphoesterase [Paenibacillaceae bacterium]|nr:metallophosphoesterase [Paenibacillaceae bacterium]